jgi:hypothetical protein
MDIQKMFVTAFPDGDADGHRRSHEAWMSKTKREEEFWMHLKKQVVAWGVIAALAWLTLIAWAGFLKGPV